MSEKPLLFISHKHDDRRIAQAVARFVRNISGGGVDVYLSSDSAFEGPRVGKQVNTELKAALWRAGVVVLVYTEPDKDWSWCMWECGVAEDPQSPDTKVVVLQCLKDEPVLFKGAVRVLAWDLLSVEAFAKRFLEKGFFPGHDKPVTGLSSAELNDAAKSLHIDLDKAIPREPAENWSAWPFLRIELDKTILAQLKGTQRVPTTQARDTVLSNALVSKAASGAADLFGRAELSVGTSFSDLVKDWIERSGQSETGWVDVVVNQIIAGARKLTPNLPEWGRLRDAAGDAEYLAAVTRIISGPNALQFDIYFLQIARVPTVSSIMTRKEKMYSLDLSSKPCEKTLLRTLLCDLERQNWNRIPVLESGRAKYVIHVSMIDRFIRKQSFDGDCGKQISDLTLADLLREDSMERLFTETWGVVARETTVAQAEVIRRNAEGCQDLFVAESGKRDDKVLGWVTDRDLAIAMPGIWHS